MLEKRLATSKAEDANNDPQKLEELVRGWNEPAPDNHQENLKRAGIMVGVSVGIILGFTAPFVFTKSPLPWMATPGPKIRRALQYLSKGGNPETNVFVDLGSGDGEAVYQAARLGYRAIGIELNFTMWAFSSMRRQLFWSAQEKANSTILWKNFFKYDLKNANTVMIFGVTPLMKSLSQKIAAECRPGTHVLAYRFGIPLAHPVKNKAERGTDSTSDLLKADVIYDQQEMRIYHYTE